MGHRNISHLVTVTSALVKLAPTPNANFSIRNCTDIMKTRNEGVEDFLLGLLIIVLTFGTIFNLLAVWVFCFKMKKWTETRIFMMNLLLSDCCLLFTLPFRIYITHYQWDLGVRFCNVLVSVYFMNTYMGIATITLISVDRFVAIKFPLRARSLRSPKKAALACAVVWLLFIATRLYIDLGSNRAGGNFCFRKTHVTPLFVTLYFAMFGVFIPMLILVFSSTQTIITLKKKEKLTIQEDKDIQKTINIVSTNLAIFLLCFMPLGIGNTVRFIMESMKLECSILKTASDFVYVAQGISDLNCCLDSVCYYFVAKEFWEKASLFPKSNKKLMQDQTQESSI
ncbi:G-protein coupled receptor 35-like [Gastrophryne carolinensis]